MDGVLWYVLTGTSGGQNRLRLLRALRDRPRNANRLASDLDLDYTTVRHHLSVLAEHDLITNTGDTYGVIYQITPAVVDNWDVIERIEQEYTDTPISS
ncbi:helix-turn-helix protein [Halohasta litchfieldiae]|jgi:DNA-binding transcriptional ArsR family regulator|uniref:Helix-turn-helix domain-containing protein n=1 Tax=Halohasta litchfieldiae TaxID=1073996 RepID=A0A1H6X920_9EURY|nr:winged helix-turn-helix domain-containing protein [Halohasta litchfieldiae]ATW90052.1 helix-turn-helix protein [Halohasta litchfieldiae]SEJ24566.1 Helix-turn-helix domain-containing protein [Halohasta litchfieldiae]